MPALHTYLKNNVKVFMAKTLVISTKIIKIIGGKNVGKSDGNKNKGEEYHRCYPTLASNIVAQNTDTQLYWWLLRRIPLLPSPITAIP